jgi:hypothetical protein
MDDKRFTLENQNGLNIVNPISDSAFGKVQTILKMDLPLSLLISAPWVKYCSKKESVMNYGTPFFD